MKEIRVFHVRWLISDKRAEPTAASGVGNPSQRCISLLMYSICFGALHTPDSAAAPSGTSRIPSGNTHSDSSRNTCQAAALPSSRRRSDTLVFQRRRRCRASGGSRRLLLQAAPGSVFTTHSFSWLILTLYLRQWKDVTGCELLKKMNWLFGWTIKAKTPQRQKVISIHMPMSYLTFTWWDEMKRYSVLFPGWSRTGTAHCTAQTLPLDFRLILKLKGTNIFSNFLNLYHFVQFWPLTLFL